MTVHAMTTAEIRNAPFYFRRKNPQSSVLRKAVLPASLPLGRGFSFPPNHWGTEKRVIRYYSRNERDSSASELPGKEYSC